MDLLPSASPGSEAPPANPGDTGSGPGTLEAGRDLRSRSPALLHVSDLCSAKGANRLSLNPRRLGSEHVHPGPVVQDVEPSHPEPLHALPDLDGESRPKGRLPTRPDQEQPSQVPGPVVLGKAVLFSGSPVRSSSGPLVVFSPDGGSTGASQGQGDQHLGLSGRLCSLERLKGYPTTPCSGDHPSSGGAGVDPKPEEVTPFSYLISRLGRGSLGLTPGHLGSATKDPSSDRLPCHSASGVPPGLKKTVGKAVRTGGLRGSDQQKGSTFKSPDLPARSLRPRPRQRFGSTVTPPPPEGACPLDKSRSLGDTGTLCSSPHRSAVLDGRVQKRLGRPRRDRSNLARSLDGGTKPPTHQRSGTVNHPASGRKTRSKGPNASSLVRQPNGDQCHYKDGLPLSGSSRAGRPPSSDLRGKKDYHQTETHKGQTECGGRRPLSGGSSARRMGVEQGGTRGAAKAARSSFTSGHVCLSAQRQAQGILLPVPTPLGLGAGRSRPRLEQVPTNPNLSSAGPYEGSGKEAPVLPGRGSHHPPGPTSAIEFVPAIPSQEGDTGGPTLPAADGESGLGIRRVRSFSRVEFLKTVYRKSYDEDVVEHLLKHLASSSLRQYESAWKRFQAWLPENATIINRSLVASFLVYCIQNLQPRTVLTIRAALALPLKEAFGIDFENEHFKMLAKAAFRLKPPVPKIVPSWSLDEALHSLERLRIHKSDRPSRFMKALFLLSVASANRVSELAAIDRKSITFRQHTAALPVRPGFIFKNQAQDHAPSEIEIPDLPGSNLCPVEALRAYLADTAGSKEETLFLHPKSGKPLNARTLAHFLTKAVSWLIPNSKPKGHDPRKLSTSKAFMEGVSASQIVAAGSWRSSNTFTKRYLVPLIPKGARAVVARARV